MPPTKEKLRNSSQNKTDIVAKISFRRVIFTPAFGRLSQATVAAAQEIKGTTVAQLSDAYRQIGVCLATSGNTS